VIADRLGCCCLEVQDRGFGQVGPADQQQEPPQRIVEPVLLALLRWTKARLPGPAA
jgi:hypothetical protein